MLKKVHWAQKKAKTNSNQIQIQAKYSAEKISLWKRKTYFVGSEVLEDVLGHVRNHLRVVRIAAVDLVEDIVLELHARVIKHVFRGIFLLVDPFDLHVVLLLNQHVLPELDLHALAALQESVGL